MTADEVRVQLTEWLRSIEDPAQRMHAAMQLSMACVAIYDDAELEVMCGEGCSQ